ncbi:GGDEF domain-containing protein [Vibrio neptunius]|uniref:diguanylate cyclase n=1 Tax=Vibrio neptunius TaxID=170651 RepID=A0ABS3A0N2_9VIBR|nr:GGDEF domain-containing protein [Vibrio neptunius]KJY94178.1 diguanylate cyclase [Vibrio neptunius]MBN3491958.1 GGDEF domain-containing protein [Vibrio neptunius]MBN3514347.1 GGDEF domain-containing protein [Vibrio neptunius]MBN3548538.1 GGDEF domain-containing protein [Vibrio neptunius]MBN3576584.1 GGDEF domain-containing protein [Vibrio neptunius]
MIVKYKRFLSGFCVLSGLAILVTTISYQTNPESYSDLLFEANTLFVLLFIYFVSRELYRSNTFIKLGLILLIVNQGYDIITEIPAFDQWADNNEFTHILIEDGGVQIAYLLIAFGVTQLFRQMSEHAYTDDLTGLFNRKKLFSIARKKFDLIYIDLDGLKQINDTQGHASGDLTIIRFAQAVNAAVSPTDKAFRIGGDEFVIVVGPGEGEAFIDRIKQELIEEQILFSYGIEASTPETLKENLIKTDKAMYEMKHSQRKTIQND